MSNTVQLVELARGASNDRPWGQTFAGFSRDKFSGELKVVEGERTYRVAFSKGAVVGADSPLATDAAVRVARLANLISPTQVSNFVRKYGASPGADEVGLLAELAKLSAEQAMDLRRKVIAHRAARTFSIESPGVAVAPSATIEIVPGIELDARGIVYQGARNNLSEQRLSAELAKMGSWFRLKPTAVDDLDAFGFGDAERTPIDRLREGGSLAELETCAPGIETRMVRAMIYALCASEACQPYAEKPAPTRRAIDAADQSQMLAPRTEIDGLLAPKPIPDLDDLMSEHADLPAPITDLRPVSEVEDLLRPVEGRERTDTILDTHNRVDLVGVTVDGRYVLERKLGEGAMGAVYLAHHTKLDRMFAVKVLHRRLLANAKSRRRFEREAELTGRLSHENVVRVVDVGTIQDLPYLAMEFAEGGSLATVMVDAPLPATRAIHLLRQLCAGLHHAHEAGLVHRDLKPSNVIVDSAGDTETLRIVDFGIAILNEPEGAERLTTRGVVLGTPDYMAPELALGKKIDHRLDLYALGVIAYELIAGVRPFKGDGVDVALANVNDPVPPMRERAPNATIDPLLEALTRTLLAKDPQGRPADAAEVRRLLDLIEKDRPAAELALGVTKPEPAPEPAAEVPVEDARAAIRTRAMWQLKREGMEPLENPPAPAPVLTTRGVAVKVVPPAPVAAATPVDTSGSSSSPWARAPSTDTAASPWAPPPSTAGASPAPAVAIGRVGIRPPIGSGTKLSTRDLATDEIRPLKSAWLIIAGVALVVFVIIIVVAIKARGSTDEPAAVPPRTHVKAPAPEPAPTPTTPPPTADPAPRDPPPVATPPAKTTANTTKPDTSVRAIRDLYMSVGKELAETSRIVGESLIADLMRRYRLIQFQASIQTPSRRAATHTVLMQLQRDTRALRDATNPSP